jgi:hypothetical protein
MRFEKRFWPGIADGSITVAFRRWEQARVLAGRSYRVAGEILDVRDVAEVSEDSITDRDAVAAGYGSADELRAGLWGDPARPLFRVEFERSDRPDPRAELAAVSELSDDDVREIDRRLDRFDKASSHGPWTRETLALIAARPATRAVDLAASVGRERDPFKIDVRKLKNLGLTESLEVGYRLSPRGQAYLKAKSRTT